MKSSQFFSLFVVFVFAIVLPALSKILKEKKVEKKRDVGISSQRRDSSLIKERSSSTKEFSSNSLRNNFKRVSDYKKSSLSKFYEPEKKDKSKEFSAAYHLMKKNKLKNAILLSEIINNPYQEK